MIDLDAIRKLAQATKNYGLAPDWIAQYMTLSHEREPLKTRVIGEWHPVLEVVGKFPEERLEADFRALLAERFGLTPIMENIWITVRRPQMNIWIRTDVEESVNDWHKDGLDSNNNCCALILWSNAAPTEIGVGVDSSSVVEVDVGAKPYSLLFVDNQEVYHRTPRGIDEKRWFVRGTMSVEVAKRVGLL